MQFGLLSAFTLAVGWGLELTLSPAICSRIRLVTLWDLLRIDLGPEPQRSIPLFAGLSSRQARIFALMSHFVSVRAGERLFGEGDRGREMFVVIDGELVASTSRGGARVEFSHMRRGDVVGVWRSSPRGAPPMSTSLAMPACCTSTTPTWSSSAGATRASPPR